jgi:hypothetical protein
MKNILLPAYIALCGTFLVLLICDLTLKRWAGAAMSFFWITYWLSRVIEVCYNRAALKLIEEARNDTIREI